MTIKKKLGLVFIFMLGLSSQAQNMQEGFTNLEKGEFAKASDTYGQVVQQNPENATAQFNHGNALYKTDKKDEAVSAYDKSISRLNIATEKSNAYYNKGVVLQNDKKLPECIEAYKNALKLAPDNEDARQNLQKALQQQKQQQQKQDQKNDKKKQDQQKDQDKKKDPKPQPSKMNKKEAEEQLKALMEQEKNLQDKLHKVNAATVNKPEKDW